MRSPNPYERLGALLGCEEAKALADRLEAGETLGKALVFVKRNKAAELRAILEESGLSPSLGQEARDVLVGMLRAIHGAKADRPCISPMWTAPQGLATSGPLNSSRDDLVRSAQSSVVCSTYNFQRSSALWDSLADAARMPGVSVKVYVDTDVCDAEPQPWKPTTAEIARELSGAMVFRTKRPGMAEPLPRNHAKFISIDHRSILVTSANFSGSAETANVELGFLVDDPPLARLVERQMAAFEGVIYELVVPE